MTSSPLSSRRTTVRLSRRIPEDRGEHERQQWHLSRISGGAGVVSGQPDSVYVFQRPSGGWAEAAKAAKLTFRAREFGSSVAISDDTVVAGKRSLDAPGLVYVFVRPAGGWANTLQAARLAASDGTQDDHFGESLAVSGDTMVAGATGYDLRANDDQGAAYMFAAHIKPLARTSLAVRVRPPHDRRPPYVLPVSDWLRRAATCP